MTLSRSGRIDYITRMKDSAPQPHVSGKSIQELQEEFRALNEQAMEIQAKMAALARQLAANGFKAGKPDSQDSTGKDTVRF